MPISCGPEGSQTLKSRHGVRELVRTLDQPDQGREPGGDSEALGDLLPAPGRSGTEEVARGTAPREELPLDLLARLEKRGDLHGVAVAYLLGGDRAHALPYLDRLPRSDDVAVDRAAAALIGGAPEEALALLETVLAANPKPTRGEIVKHMDGNICRCGTYHRIARAIERASREA